MTDDRDEIREMNRKVHAFRAQFLDYPLLKDIREDFHMLVERDNTAAEGGVMTLIGVSGSGKTKFIEDFMREYPRERHAIRHADGRIADRATVILVAVPDTGVKTLAEAIYAELTGAEAPADRRVDIQKAIYHYAEEMETKLIIFEEAHEASVDETNKTVKAVSRLFKQFSNAAKFSVLIVGTEEADRLVRANKELGRRVLARHELEPLDWDKVESRKLLLLLLRSWDKLLEDVLVPCGLGTEEFAAKIHLSSGGIIGLAAILVERAALLAVRDKVGGRMRGTGEDARPVLGIDERHLHEAHRSVGRSEPNPFDGGSPNVAPGQGRPGTVAWKVSGGPGAEPPAPLRTSSRRAAKDRVFRP